MELRQSTAGQEIPLGYFLDSTDGNTEETGLTIANTDLLIWKFGSTSLVAKNSGGATHMQNGIYYTVLDATDTNTLGGFKIFCHISGALVCIFDGSIITANAWDSKYSTDNLQVDLVQISGDSTAADNLEATYDGTGYDDPFAPSQQQQIENIAIGSSGISTTAESAVLTTGTQTNTYTATKERDGINHQIEDDSGTTDIYYQCDIGATGIPSTVTIFGRSNGGNDDIGVFGYNWGTTSWEQIGIIEGQVGNTNSEHTFSMYNTHIGTGTNAGKVRIRFYATGLSSANLYVDQLYVSYSVVKSAVGYANGSVWVDTINGTAGAVQDVNGVADNPVNNMADLNSLLTLTGLSRVYVMSGSSITLAQSQTNLQFDGCNYNLALGGQDISGSRFRCAKVTGIATGTTQPQFEDCHLGLVTLPPSIILNCGIGMNSGSFIGGSLGQFVFTKCYSLVPGSASPSFTFSGLGTTGINNRGWTGGSSYTLDANCTLSHEVLAGGGQTFTTGGANVEVRGISRAITLILSGAGTIQTTGITGPVTISGTSTATVNLYGVMSELFDSSTGTTINDNTISSDTIGDIVEDTGATIPDQITALNDVSTSDIQTYCDVAITANSDINNIDTGVNNIEAKLPTNNIMGSGVKTDKDDEIDAILLNTGTTIPATLSGMSGATFNTTTDSLEAIRNRGDVAWITGGGGGLTDILNIQMIIPTSIDLANTATVRLGMMLTNAIDDLPATAEITPGTISIDRKAIGGTSWTSIVSDSACLELDGLIYYDEVFNSATNYAEGDSLRITFKAQKITVSGNDHEITSATGVMFQTEIRQTMVGTNGANTVIPDVAGTAATLIGNLNDITVADIIAGISEGSLDFAEIIRIILAGTVGVSTGSGTGTITFRDVANLKPRITTTVSGNNRTVVALDGSE